jgi:hypothetical protein
LVDPGGPRKAGSSYENRARDTAKGVTPAHAVPSKNKALAAAWFRLEVTEPEKRRKSKFTLRFRLCEAT